MSAKEDISSQKDYGALWLTNWFYKEKYLFQLKALLLEMKDSIFFKFTEILLDIVLELLDCSILLQVWDYTVDTPRKFKGKIDQNL